MFGSISDTDVAGVGSTGTDGAMMGETAAGTVTIRARAAAAAVDPRDNANLGALVRAGREQMGRDARLMSNP